MEPIGIWEYRQQLLESIPQSIGEEDVPLVDIACYDQVSGNSHYTLKSDLDIKTLQNLWTIVFLSSYEREMKNWSEESELQIIAYWFHRFRGEYKRLVESKESDWIKAVYLRNLRTYFKNKKTRILKFNRYDFRMKEMICLVNNIFDWAYHLKNSCPQYSDLEAFTRAERKFCEEKELDYLANNEFLERTRNNLPGDASGDWEKAIARHRKNMVEVIAESISLERKKRGLPIDWDRILAQAEKEYPKWKKTRQIALLCWLKSKDPSLPMDNYWFKAEKVVKILEKNRYSYMEKDPFQDETIIGTIDDDINNL